MQNAVALLYLACGSFVACFLGEFFQFANNFGFCLHFHLYNTTVLTLYPSCLYFGGILEGYCWTRTGERQAARMRARYLKAVLRQEVAYFDLHVTSTSEVITSVSNDSLVIQDCLSEKV